MLEKLTSENSWQNQSSNSKAALNLAQTVTRTLLKSSFKETNDKYYGYRRIDIYRRFEEAIKKSQSAEVDIANQLKMLKELREQQVNILLVGATGSGKSSTINALFDMEVAEVGYGVDPQTREIAKYKLDNLIVWDSPGLGDAKLSDEKTMKCIATKLRERAEDGKPLIDLVVVILDASAKDMGTFYQLMNNVLIPNLKQDAQNRILVALNQSDLAMKGKHWNEQTNRPDDILTEQLKNKVASVRRRIKENSGIDIVPIYYCAGYSEKNGVKRRPYNLTKLFYGIVQAIPNLKRFALIDNINSDESHWRDDDGEADYFAASRNQFYETLWLYATDGFDDGAEIGSKILGIPGKYIGGTIGGAIGTVQGVIEALFN